MNKSVKKVLEACFELTTKKENYNISINGRLRLDGELTIEYIDYGGGNPKTLGAIIIVDGKKIFSNYQVHSSMECDYARPLERHFEFLQYLQKESGVIIENEFACSQYLQKIKEKNKRESMRAYYLQEIKRKKEEN